MKFKKELPKEQGYYWYVDLDYPVPVIGFVGPFYTFYNSKMEKINESYYKYLRFGELIPVPEPDIEV